MTKPSARFSTKRLTWRDISLGVIMLENGGRIRLTLGLGSGRSQRPNQDHARPNGRVGPLLVARHLGRPGVESFTPSRSLDIRLRRHSCLARAKSSRPGRRPLITGWMSILDHSRKTVLRELAGQPPTELTKALEMEGGRNRYSLGLEPNDRQVRAYCGAA
jgi:hypothetical protein